MSCYLTHKEAINNFKEDLSKTGYKEIIVSENSSIKEIANHNLLVEQEAAKLQPVIDSWDKAVAVMGLPGNVVKSIISHSTSFGVTKKILDIQINESVFDKIDDKRKELRIYDSKLAYSSYIENRLVPNNTSEEFLNKEELSLEDYYISHKSLYEEGTYEEYLQYREKTNNKLEIASKEDVSLFKKYVEEQDIDSQLDFNNKCK